MRLSPSIGSVLRVPSGDATTDPAPAPEGLFLSRDLSRIALGRITATEQEVQMIHVEHPPRPDCDVEPCQDYEAWSSEDLRISPELEGYCFDCGWHKEDHNG